MKKKAHKRNLKKSTRLDEENKKNRTTWKKFRQTVRNVYWFIWNDIKRTGLWNCNHRKFKILAQQWHWNYSKTVSQLIVINFLKSLPDYRIFLGRITLFVFYLSFFLYFEFWSTSFLLFCNTLTNTNPEFQNFPVSKSIAIRQNS